MLLLDLWCVRRCGRSRFVAKAVDRRYQALWRHSGLQVADLGVTMLETDGNLQNTFERFQRLFHAPHAEHSGHPLNRNRDSFLLGNSCLSSCT